MRPDLELMFVRRRFYSHKLERESPELLGVPFLGRDTRIRGRTGISCAPGFPFRSNTGRDNMADPDDLGLISRKQVFE